jgi:hypothetical protein
VVEVVMVVDGVMGAEVVVVGVVVMPIEVGEMAAAWEPEEVVIEAGELTPVVAVEWVVLVGSSRPAHRG